MCMRGGAAAAYCLVWRDANGDGPDYRRAAAGDGDAGSGDFWVGLSGGELCALGAAGWGADSVRGAGRAAECQGVQPGGAGEGWRGAAGSGGAVTGLFRVVLSHPFAMRLRKDGAPIFVLLKWLRYAPL